MVASTPKVSVALATYNGADFLEAQLESIIRQSKEVDEIVVSDDASNDGTCDIVRSFEARLRAELKTVEIVLLENTTTLGVVRNFEKALQACRGGVVFLCDQDDIWRENKVEKALSVFAAAPDTQLFASNADLVDENSIRLGATLFRTLGVSASDISLLNGVGALTLLLRRNILTGATMAVTNGLIRRASPFPESWVHDEWLAFVAAVEAASGSGGVAVIDESLIDYRQHDANVIGASRLGLRGKINRLRTPRTFRNDRLFARARAANQIINERSTDLSPELGTMLAEKLNHERVRSGYPNSPLARIGPVFREWRTGRYGQYGLGVQDIIRDLIQPL